MTEQTPHTKIRIVAFSDHEEVTENAINKFNDLFTAERVFDRKWKLVRKKATETENSFYLGGGRMDLPKRQITFDNTEIPASIFHEEGISENIVEYCNSADIFLFCIDLQNLPEIWKINRLAYTIKQVDREKIILYAVLNFKYQSAIQNNFDKYADFAVEKHIELVNGTAEEFSEEQKNLLQYGYLFPYTDLQNIVTKQNKRFNIRKTVFCFGKCDNFGYIDCLLYCINLMYAGEFVEITMTNNKLYHYLTTNINFNYSNDMAKSIKLAVVGAADNGKSHFISDVFRALNLMQIDYNVKKYPDYAQVAHYLNDIVGKKEINPTDVLNLTRNEHHYKGYIQILDRNIEFMDIPGEAFMDAENISGTYQQIKDVVKDYYTHSLFKQIFCKKEKYILIEEYRTQGNTTKITLSLNNKNIAVESEKKKRTKDSDEVEETEKTETVDTKNKPEKTKPVSGKYVVENFERYDTDNLKSVLKQIVEEQKDNKSYPNLRDIDDEFWQNFYAYVFCDNCDDIILCELLALPKSATTNNNSSKKAKIKKSDFKNCLNGIKTFFSNKNPRMYIVFKGLDAMLNHEDGTFKKLFGSKKGISIIKSTPYIYLLIHLAIYKKYMTEVVGVSEKFEDLLNYTINNKNSGFLRDENLKHLFNEGEKKLLIDLDNILLEKSEFILPRDSNGQGIENHLAARISDIQNFGNDNNRFKVDEDKNTDSPPNFILPHLYFTAYPIDAIRLTVHKNSSTNRQSFDGLNIEQRLPIGTFNFVADWLNANGIANYHTGTDLENLLYKNN